MHTASRLSVFVAIVILGACANGAGEPEPAEWIAPPAEVTPPPKRAAEKATDDEQPEPSKAVDETKSAPHEDPEADAGSDADVTEVAKPVAAKDAGAPPVVVVDASAPVVDSGTTTTTACVPRLVVSEVQTGGASSSADEFVEIANLAPCAADLEGYSIRYLSATGNAPMPLWTGASGDAIPASGRVVVAGRSFSGSAIGTFSGSTSGVLATAGGGVGLFDATGQKLDSVGYGTANNAFVEGSAVDAPAAGKSIGRSKTDLDTGDNDADFKSRTPTPGAVNR